MAKELKQQATVATPCAAYNDMSKHWDLPDDLRGGTLAMRAAGTKWLPLETKEEPEKYAARLSRSTLFNAYKDAITMLTSKPFSRDIKLTSPLPESMAILEDDANGEGKSLHDFAKELFDEAVHRGLTYILVDFTRVQMDEEGRPLTIADEQRLGLRPYFVHVSPKTLIGWKKSSIGGSTVLTEIRIRSKVQEQSAEGWEESEEEYIYVLRQTNWERWKRKSKGENESNELKTDDWEIVDSGTNTLGKIALVPIYFNQTGYMTAVPCLEDLAWVNLSHWQSSSDQRNILRFARTGLLFIKGISDEDAQKPVIVGPSQSYKVSSENADAKFVELGSGGSIQAGERDIDKLEEQMQRLGAQPLVRRSGSETATGKVIDESSNVADILSWIRSLEIAIKKALELAAEWLKITSADDMAVNIYNEFSLLSKTTADLPTINEARARGDLTLPTYLVELQRRDVLSSNLDVEKEAKAAEEEKDTSFDMNLAFQRTTQDEEDEGASDEGDGTNDDTRDSRNKGDKAVRQ